MASRPQLDAARGPGHRRVIPRILLFVGLLAAPLVALRAQDRPSDAARLAAAQAAFDAGKFTEAAHLAQGPANQSSDLDYLEGLALARLERWNDAKASFEAGHRKAPQDARFLVELAGVAYKQKDRETAKHDLRTALRLAPRDAYASEFLGTLYFLEGNLDAALKYWNAAGKPRLRSVTLDPQPKLRHELLARAVTFNAPQVLTASAAQETEDRLANLGVFPHQRLELAEAPSGEYDASLHLAQRDGLGDSWLEGAVSLFSGLPYDTVYPEVYNLAHDAINFTSLARWDSQKRRYSGDFSMPLFDDPGLCFRIYVDARNENWNLSETFSAAGSPLTDLNMQRIVGGAEFRSVVSDRWSWRAGAEIAHRDFRNLDGHTGPGQAPFFTDSDSLASWLGAERSLLRIPENRFTLDSSAEVRAGRTFSDELGPFATVRGSLRAHWFPRASGDDFEMQAQIRAGATAGKVTLDELFQLGLERDNDLWLRGQPGTMDGRKGAAPLGRRYFLANWEMDKNVYHGAFFNLKLGPFLDNGAIADSSGVFGSRRWLWDAGAQCKVRILGSLTVVLSYGHDLRGGRAVYYGTVVR